MMRAAVFIFLGALTAQAAVDEAGFRKTVIPFLENYCLDCHDNETQEGKLSLEGIRSAMTDGALETWRVVQEQLRFADMPPAKKKQPKPAERAAVLAWIRGELLKTQEPGALAEEKLTQPQFGNYVDHAALFGQRRSYVTPAPPRLWRLRPAIYNATMPRLGERITGLANGLNQNDGSDFKDFSAGYFLDEAATAPLLGNAKKIAEKAGALYDKFANFLKDVEDVGKALAKASGAHEAALNKLSEGKGNILRRTEELKKLGIASKKEIPATFQTALEEGDLESAPLPNILEEPENSPDEGEEQARSA